MHTHISLSLHTLILLYTHELYFLLASEYSIAWIYHDLFNLCCLDRDLYYYTVSMLCKLL